jgi:hypothetical protein
VTSDTGIGERVVTLRRRPPYGADAVTVHEFAEELGVDEEAAMTALVDLGCRGLAETDLHRWRPIILELTTS